MRSATTQLPSQILYPDEFLIPMMPLSTDFSDFPNPIHFFDTAFGSLTIDSAISAADAAVVGIAQKQKRYTSFESFSSLERHAEFVDQKHMWWTHGLIKTIESKQQLLVPQLSSRMLIILIIHLRCNN